MYGKMKTMKTMKKGKKAAKKKGGKMKAKMGMGY